MYKQWRIKFCQNKILSPLIQLFRRTDIVPAIAIVILTILLNIKNMWLVSQSYTLWVVNKTTFGAWPMLQSTYTQHAAIFTILSILGYILFVFYFNYVINREQIFKLKSNIPALSIVLFSSFFPSSILISTLLIASIFIFISVTNVFNLSRQSTPRRQLFNTGMLLGIACFFYFPAIFFIIVCLLALMLTRALVPQEIAALLLGFMVVFFLMFSFHFVATHHFVLFDAFNSSLFKIGNKMGSNKSILVILVTLLACAYSFFILQSRPNYPIQLKKKWTAIVIYALVASILSFIGYSAMGLCWTLAIPPISIILSMCFQHKRELFNNITFVVLIVFILIYQWLL